LNKNNNILIYGMTIVTSSIHNRELLMQLGQNQESEIVETREKTLGRVYACIDRLFTRGLLLCILYNVKQLIQ